MTLDGGAASSPKAKACTACGGSLEKASYSSKQWKAKADKRRCKECVETETHAGGGTDAGKMSATDRLRAHMGGGAPPASPAQADLAAASSAAAAAAAAGTATSKEERGLAGSFLDDNWSETESHDDEAAARALGVPGDGGAASRGSGGSGGSGGSRA